METLATWLVNLLFVYAGLGIVFAIPFVLAGAGRVDPSAREGTWGFKLLILPGAAALWPLLAKRWLGGTTAPPEETNSHRGAASRRAAREADG